jgi:hypothetical protein
MCPKRKSRLVTDVFIHNLDPSTLESLRRAVSHWICFRHLEKWNADRDRFLADGGGCEMQELGELLDERCASEEV